MRIFYAIGYLAGSAILAASRPSEADRLRAENRELTREVYDLAAICDALRVQLSRAEAMLQHPSHRGAVGTSHDDHPLTAEEVDVLAAEFIAAKYLGDVLWVMGGE